mmetsp:Transcript_44589/g.96168  ORF Transcript_44589/g.96168 Transcript_44589/m.96168 type:complete len:175 (-) Transcript_44589:86-610(-)
MKVASSGRKGLSSGSHFGIDDVRGILIWGSLAIEDETGILLCGSLAIDGAAGIFVFPNNGFSLVLMLPIDEGLGILGMQTESSSLAAIEECAGIRGAGGFLFDSTSGMTIMLDRALSSASDPLDAASVLGPAPSPAAPAAAPTAAVAAVVVPAAEVKLRTFGALWPLRGGRKNR